MRVVFTTIAGALVVAYSATAIAKPATITQTTEFLKAVAAVRADSQNHDKFTDPLKSALNGQAFKAVVPFDTNMSVWGAAKYDYKDGKLLLSLEPDKSAPLLQKPGGGVVPVIPLAEHTRSLGSYIGQNAFGAVARVQSRENDGVGIALVSTPRSEKHDQIYDGTVMGSKRGWFFEQALPGADAKALALNSSIVIEGTYGALPWGGSGFCDFTGSEATISNPNDYYREACYLGAKVTRIAFVDERTGTVLKEWNEANDPSVGAELWGHIRLGMDKFQVKAIWPSMTDYGDIEANGQHVSVRMDDDRVARVEMMLPPDFTGATYKLLQQKFGPPAAVKCVVEAMCNAKWSLNRDVAAYLIDGNQLVFQAADAAVPMGFSL